MLSFHATKVFNTFEGGAIVCPDAKTKQRIDHLKNFGFVDEVTVVAPGINGKMSEFNAAFGLLQLKHIDGALARRKEIDAAYRQQLAGVQGIQCLGDAGEDSGQSRLLPDPGAARLPAEPRCAVPETEGSRHPCPALLLSADFGLSDVPGHALGAAEQPAGGYRRCGQSAVPADLPGLDCRRSSSASLTVIRGT